jgi:hypothetical protein
MGVRSVPPYRTLFTSRVLVIGLCNFVFYVFVFSTWRSVSITQLMLLSASVVTQFMTYHLEISRVRSP